MKNDIVPPTINHEEGDDDPELDYNLNFTFNKAQKTQRFGKRMEFIIWFLELEVRMIKDMCYYINQ